MEDKNLVLSTSYLEFINNLDNLVYELLYSENGGYTNLTSKIAIFEAKKVVEKYNHEALKLKKDIEFANADSIILEKEKELIAQIKKHYSIELRIWADEVYQTMFENCLLAASIHKNEPEAIDKIYSRLLSGVSWISTVKNLSPENQQLIINELNFEFQKALTSSDIDYIPPKEADESIPLTFLELRNLICSDENKFLSIDFSAYSDELIQDDIAFLNRVKKDIQTFKKTTVKDEILLVNSAIEVLKLKNNNEKYEFIKQIDNDFNSFVASNNKIEEKDKIDLIKRRMELFKNSIQKNTTSNYFKSLITS